MNSGLNGLKLKRGLLLWRSLWGFILVSEGKVWPYKTSHAAQTHEGGLRQWKYHLKKQKNKNNKERLKRTKTYTTAHSSNYSTGILHSSVQTRRSRSGCSRPHSGAGSAARGRETWSLQANYKSQPKRKTVFKAALYFGPLCLQLYVHSNKQSSCLIVVYSTHPSLIWCQSSAWHLFCSLDRQHSQGDSSDKNVITWSFLPLIFG